MTPASGSNTDRQQRGKQAEDAARRYLESRGLRLLEKNYRCKRGEIDLIMRDRDMLVFVEVRYRNNTRFGSGADSVDQRKQTKLQTTALHYLQHNPQAARSPCRFDVVSISHEALPENINWIANAFEVS